MKKYDAYGNPFTLRRFLETKKEAAKLNRQHIKVKTFRVTHEPALNHYCPVCYMSVGLPDGKCPCGVKKKQTEELRDWLELLDSDIQMMKIVRKSQRAYKIQCFFRRESL